MAGEFSDIVMDHFRHPRHARPLPFPDGTGWVTRAQNKFMRIQIQVLGDTIEDVAFGTYGCAPAIASGSYLCEWACGRTLRSAQSMTVDGLLDALGGLPAHRRDCAEMAVQALREAISNTLSKSHNKEKA